MCRLFGHAAQVATRATHWFDGAGNSLKNLSMANPHGTGVAAFDELGRATTAKWAQPAHEVEGLQGALDAMDGVTLVGHIRAATPGMGGTALENVHPFVDGDMAFAHNGAVADKHIIERELGPLMERVTGETDSERYFHLLKRNIERAGGDVPVGVAETARWLDEHAGVDSINFVLATPTDLWAFRYPENRTLYHAEVPAGFVDAQEAARIVASEPLDDVLDWQAMTGGQLLRLGTDGSGEMHDLSTVIAGTHAVA